MGRSQTYRGLVNAVLRRVAEAGSSVLEDKPSAARLNTPGWLWEGWRKAYGADTVADIAAVHMQEPPLDFTILKGAPVDWANRFGGFVLPTGGVRLARSTKATDLPGYSAGSWLPQDAAAAMPACLFGDLGGKQVIDLCAAPGGKTAQLAAKGAQVTAVDMGELRMERLAENMNRLGLTVKTVVADALEWRPEALVDAVLLDAPCSATGTIRRHPDVPWTKTTGAVRSLLPIQSELMDAAAEMVRPGGMLIYACCSLQPEEGPAQAAAFLKRRPDFVRAPISLDDLPGLPAEAITEQGDLRTLPSFWADRGGMDGFYGVRLVKQPQ
jgi:16S rRNA (cytosine967-C5)-methyltransferase